MTNSSGPKRHWSGRLKLLFVAAVVVIGLTIFAALSLLGCSVFASRGEVDVMEAKMQSPERLELVVASCNENPEVSLLRETEDDVQVRVIADYDFFAQSGDDCQDIVEVQLQDPLGDRVVIDERSGQQVSVTEIRQPGRQEQSQESGTEKTSVDDAPWIQPAENEGAARHEIAVNVAWLRAPDTLVINANTCHRNPELSMFQETDVDVTVKMAVGPDPYPNGGPDCLEELIVQLERPLGDRTVTDAYNGRALSVTPVPTATPSAGRREQTESPPTEAVPPEIRDAVSDAELQDLQAVAEQYGMTLQEAFDRYAWNDNFSRAVSRVREAAPETFAGAEIVDGSHAWIAFTGPPPAAALDIIDAFTSSHSSISVEVRTNKSITAAELEEAIPAVHFAVYRTRGVLNANTSFNSETDQIEMLIVLANTTPDSILDELLAIAEKRLIEVTRLDILDDISISIVRSKHPDINATE